MGGGRKGMPTGLELLLVLGCQVFGSASVWPGLSVVNIGTRESRHPCGSSPLSALWSVWFTLSRFGSGVASLVLS